MGHLDVIEIARIVGYAVSVPMLVTLAFMTYHQHWIMAAYCFLQAGVYMIQLYSLVSGGALPIDTPLTYLYTAFIFVQAIITVVAVVFIYRWRRKIIKKYMIKEG